MIQYETNSSKIRKGQTFVAIKGNTVDGHDYVEEAIRNGAKNIVAEKNLNVSVPVLVVSDTEAYLRDRLVSEYSFLLSSLTLVGVTGTNGKTTTCYLTYQLLNKMGIKTAYIGTIGYFVEDKQMELANTTPDILTLYQLLLDAKDKGCSTVVMEVSSHALSLRRLDGLKFKIGAFTNLTEDHLDFYHTMDKYLEAKVEILDYMQSDGIFIVNADDQSSSSFLEKANCSKTLGLNRNNDLVLSSFKIYPSYTEIEFKEGQESYFVKTNLTSKFNVYNYAMVFLICTCLGYSKKEIIEKTSYIYPPKGRCETFSVNASFAVVDYAHTPDAVLKVISAYKEFAKARVITIIGCGGDRDPMKRPIMGKIATNESDYVLFTNDNPRTENPENIMKDILKGVEKNNYEVILDRHQAIQKGLSLLKKDDILLILGKGHEDYQILGRKKVHFDDAEEIKMFCENH